MELSTVIFLLLAILGWGLGAFFDKACLKHMDPSGAFYVRSLFMPGSIPRPKPPW